MNTPGTTRFFLAAALLAGLAPAASAAVYSTASIRTNTDALELMSQQFGHNTDKFLQDYMYTGNDRTRGISSRQPVYADPALPKTPAAQYNAKPAVYKAEARTPVPALTVSPQLPAAMQQAVNPPPAAAQQKAASAPKSDRNVVQKIGDWLSGAYNTVAGWVKSAVNWVGEQIMGRSRHLTPEEEAEMRKIYGDKVDYSKVKIIDGSKKGLWGWILTSGGAAVTWGNRIYFPEGKYSFANNPGWLAHEMGHNYQYHRDGWSYTLKSVWGQLRHGDAFYEYQLEAGKGFRDYNVEQQAELVEHYYQILNGTRSATPEERAMYAEIMAGEGLFQ